MQEFTGSYSSYMTKHPSGTSLRRMNILYRRISLVIAMGAALIGSLPLFWTGLWLIGAGYAFIVLIVAYSLQSFVMHQCIPEIKGERASVPKGIFWYTAGMVWMAQIATGFIAFLYASDVVHWQLF